MTLLPFADVFATPPRIRERVGSLLVEGWNFLVDWRTDLERLRLPPRLREQPVVKSALESISFIVHTETPADRHLVTEEDELRGLISFGRQFFSRECRGRNVGDSENLLLQCLDEDRGCSEPSRVPSASVERCGRGGGVSEAELSLD